MIRLAIFDLDDTLVDTSHVYWVARSSFISCMERASFEPEVALEEFERIDGENIIKYGYVPERYEMSMLSTYSHLCGVAGASPLESVRREIRQAGSIVKDVVPELIPGAIELLDEVRLAGYKSLLITRGVEQVQHRKIEHHDLVHHFDQIRVVKKKDAEVFDAVIKEMGSDAAQCWVIGDSIRSDINPGIRAGANAILYLYTHHSYYWRQEYGVTPEGAFYIAESLSDVLAILCDSSVGQKVTQVPIRDPDLPS